MDSPLAQEPPQVQSFRKWLEDQGAYIHPAIFFQSDDNGMGVYTSTVLLSDSTIVSCPFSLAITPTLASSCLQKAILQHSNSEKASDISAWNERELICSYLVMHWVLEPTEESSSTLLHYPYLKTLPPPSSLRTPLYFVPAELELLKGTNMYGATADRQQAWKDEWKKCQAFFKELDQGWGDKFRWERYLAASTYLSSRAFPSSVLSDTPTLSDPSSHPVLVPLIDSLNHERGQPVSWIVSKPAPESSENLLSLKLHGSFLPHDQLLNNYGPKPNSELLLGYGFTMPYNPDDTIVLQLGGGGQKWEVGREARGIDGLWREILDFTLAGEDEVNELEGIVGAAEMLEEMIDDKISRLAAVDGDCTNPEIRPEVWAMIQHYISGQHDILLSIKQFALDKADEADLPGDSDLE